MKDGNNVTRFEVVNSGMNANADLKKFAGVVSRMADRRKVFKFQIVVYVESRTRKTTEERENFPG
jgi:hypothetical protein